MAGFSQDFIETVRGAGDIVQLIGDFVPLKRAGARFKGLCPFHQEKTPSFSVDAEAQLFYCFGCQTGGDLFKFVMLYEKVGFPEAVELVARRFAVQLPQAQAADDPQARLLQMNAAAQSFYRAMLRDPETGSRCRAYIEGRGLGAETIERLGLGYAPGGWDALRNHLLAKRFKPEELLRGGLTLSRQSGRGEYDRFRDRLIFPIHDAAGRTVAFGGRLLGEGEPKYLNSPETPTYVKGEHLYGLDLAREAIRQAGYAVMVEGYLDLAAVVQAGCAHAVASLGTALTPVQVRLLARYADHVVVSYDGDAAGSAATVRSLDLLLERGLRVRVVDLPAGMDPDDFIRAEGAEAYRARLDAAPDYLEFLVQREARARDLNRIEEQVAGANAVLPHLVRLTSAIERGTWAGRLADALRIDDALVLQELRAALAAARPTIRQRPRPARLLTEAEVRLVLRLLRCAEERQRWAGELDPADLEGTQVVTIVDAILQLERASRPVDAAAVLEVLSSEADRELLTRVAFRDEPESGPSVEDCLWTFRRKRLEREGRESLRGLVRWQQGSSQPGTDALDVDERLVHLQELHEHRDRDY